MSELPREERVPEVDGAHVPALVLIGVKQDLRLDSVESIPLSEENSSSIWSEYK